MTSSETNTGYFAVAPPHPHGLWSVTEGRGGRVVAYSRTAPCAELAASRLFGSEPVESPDAATRRWLRLYGRAFPDRFSLYARRYLMPGSWLWGGVTDGDVTGVSVVGRRQEITARCAAREAMGAEMGWRGLPPLPEDDLWLRVGECPSSWPIASGASDLPRPTARSAAERLAAMRTRDVDPEWLEDARLGVRMLIQHAADGEALAHLRGLALRLAAAHGGSWSP